MLLLGKVVIALGVLLAGFSMLLEKPPEILVAPAEVWESSAN